MNKNKQSKELNKFILMKSGVYNKVYSKVQKLNEVRKKKTIVFVICTMRSGSTLLKSLLANAPDTSHLPEIDFQKYNQGNAWRIKMLSPAKIIILKKPAPFDAIDYPQIPVLKNSKKIVLVRDVYDTVISIQKMNKAISSELDKAWPLEKIVHDYWAKTYQSLLDRLPISNNDYKVINYENLVTNPLKYTQEIFHFIGSTQKKGVDKYSSPKTFNWEWGKDDGGKKIQSLSVQYIPSKKENQELLKIIQTSDTVQQLRKRLGYSNSII